MLDYTTDIDVLIKDVYGLKSVLRGNVMCRIRTCNNSCSHFDLINQCCWIVTNRGIFREVQEGINCLYGFKENE